MNCEPKRNTLFLRRGRNRHNFLRRVMSKVRTLSDLKKTFIHEVADYLRELFPHVNVKERLFVKSEVSILNRRPDFVLYIPNVVIILLEYKTSNVTVDVRQSYLKQTKDTMTKFEQCHIYQNERTESDKIKLISLLLIRNSSTKENRLLCLKSEDIVNRPLFFFI